MQDERRITVPVSNNPSGITEVVTSFRVLLMSRGRYLPTTKNCIVYLLGNSSLNTEQPSAVLEYNPQPKLSDSVSALKFF